MSAPTLLPRPAWLPWERWPFPTGALATAVGQIAVTDVGEGPTLLFVHVGSWSFVWRDLLVALSPHHRCVALDAPGSGLSSHPDSVVGLEAAALAVSAVIDELDLREITLVMHDVGGPVGLAAAARQPDRIAGLVALNALGWRPTGAALRGMLAVMASAPIRESAALLGWAARLSASAFGAGREWTDEDRAVFLTGMNRPSRHNTHRYLRALRTENDLLQRAEAALRGPLSRLPLLTVFGSRNDPFKLGQKWKQLFPDAEQHTIPGGNHYPMGDDPAGVSTLIRRWHSAHVRGAHQPQRSGSLPAPGKPVTAMSYGSYAVARPSADHARQRRTHRAWVVAAAAAVTGLAWLAGYLAGVTYLVVTPVDARPIALGLVAAGTAASGSAGWAVLALLERYTSRARTAWTALALAVLTSSIVPIFVFPADVPTRATLTLLHCLAAAIFIPGLLHIR